MSDTPRRLRFLLALMLAARAPAALADLWAYVDEQGRSHVANRQLDARYKLFFKGNTTLDVPDVAQAERARAVEALAGTQLYERATNRALTRRFEPLIDTHARANGLDPALVMAVVAVESAFDPGAVSAKGAVGLMQVLPATGARYGVAGDARSMARKLLDPATNLRVGTRYLKDLLARFAHDIPLALAAYNAGEATVEANGGRVPPFQETRTFVTLVQRVYALYRAERATPVAPVRIIRAQSRGAAHASRDEASR